MTGGSGASATAFTDAGLTGVRALIVDADDRQRMTLSGHLSDWGIRIGTVVSVMSAIAPLDHLLDGGEVIAVGVGADLGGEQGDARLRHR